MIGKKRRSIFSSIVRREYGYCREDSFEHDVSRFFERKQLLNDPEIVSPHRSSISGLDMDSASGRFLITGSIDATVSIFDISKWGSGDNKNNTHHHHQQQQQHRQQQHRSSSSTYHPVARSQMVPAVSNILEVPNGHSSSTTYVQWYPTDTGVFLSGSSDGTILVWDTNQMKPVLRVLPFAGDDNIDGDISNASSSATWISANLRTTGGADYHSLLVAGSWNHPQVKLIDIRSGASSHHLVGHQAGVSCVQWSPTNSHILASGSLDGNVLLWDGTSLCSVVV